jgi:NADH dehydrogenase FAD-containing subunit
MRSGIPQMNLDIPKAGPRSTGAAKPGATRVVIVGAGFAGLEVAKALEATGARVTVLDRHNYTLFQPLLYQVATAALSPADVAVPLRSLLRSANIEILLEEAEGVELESACVRTRSGRRLQYDFLVLATGSRFDYFGHVNWPGLAPSPKSLADAIEIRQRLLLAFERAEMLARRALRWRAQSRNLQKQRLDVTFAGLTQPQLGLFWWKPAHECSGALPTNLGRTPKRP